MAAITIIWTPKSLQQMELIAEYIALDSPYHARRVVSLIVRATRRLKTFPESGAVVPELGDPTIREVRVFSYRILYRWRSNLRQVHILGVVHGRQILDDSAIL